jgi:hypothetical protein
MVPREGLAIQYLLGEHECPRGVVQQSDRPSLLSGTAGLRPSFGEPGRRSWIIDATPLHVGREPLLKSVDPSCNRLHKRTQSRANVPRKERK